MLAKLDSTERDFAARFSKLTAQRRALATPEVAARVTAIIQQIHKEGINGLLQLIKQHDRNEYPDLTALTYDRQAFAQAFSEISPEQASYLRLMKEHIHTYHSRQIEHGWFEKVPKFGILGSKIVPLARIGLYVPGGQALYPSSVLMGCVPAKIAEVSEIVIATPGGAAGKVAPLVLAAAYLGEADYLYAMGGAQAIAALALGSAGIKKVDKIVGPGNAYVTEAKRQLYGLIGIDSLAGPSELAVVADASAPINWLVADMFAQAEHSDDTKVFLFSADAQVLSDFAQAVEQALPLQPRREIIKASLSNSAALIKCRNTEEAIRLADSLAAEHLQLMLHSAISYRDLIKYSAAVFCGIHTSAVHGDYGAGPNHTLPTGGSARFSSPLGVYDFTKRISFLELKPETAHRIAPATAEIATAEGLPAHAQAAKLRVDEEPTAPSARPAAGTSNSQEQPDSGQH